LFDESDFKSDSERDGDMFVWNNEIEMKKNEELAKLKGKNT